MLEIPEAQTVAQQLRKAIGDKIVSKVIAADSPHGFAFYNEPPEKYAEMLQGKSIDNASAIAGQVELSLGTVRLLFNDGIGLKYCETGTKPPKKHQFYMEFTDGSYICCTVRMYGGMCVFEEGTYANPYYLVALEKPSPLGDDFSPAHFQGIVSAAKPSLSIKALLATEQRIPGLGNGCLHDILFNARMNPMSKVSSLSKADTERLYESLRETLGKMTRLGGRDTEKDIFGNPGGYKTILSSKTLPFPCPSCGGAISRRAFLGGNVYYCPDCQLIEA